ncbi:hypothetical protein SAMN05216284_115116 [Micromonospora sediminimaris]|nr:hypothetical protein SAMN05216284_115116 [Micromonospora sediminimaris]
MLLHQCCFGLGPAVFIRENRRSTPTCKLRVVMAKWLWGNPPTLV